MPTFEWRGDGEFADHANDRTIQPGETVEIDESIARGHREFVEVEAETSDDESGGVPDLSGSEWQSLAAAYDGFEDVNGQSSAADIKAAYEALSDDEQADALDAFGE